MFYLLGLSSSQLPFDEVLHCFIGGSEGAICPDHANDREGEFFVGSTSPEVHGAGDFVAEHGGDGAHEVFGSEFLIPGSFSDISFNFTWKESKFGDVDLEAAV